MHQPVESIRTRWRRGIRFSILLTLAGAFVILYSMSGYSLTDHANASVANASVTQPSINRTTSPAALDRQARSHFAASQFTEAVDLFQQAAQAYQRMGDSIHQAISLSNLALTYQQLGRWDEANQAIADSLALVDEQQSHAFAQVLDIKAGLHLAQGQAEQAIAIWQQVTQLYDQQGNEERAIASRLGQAQSYQSLGLLRRAIALLGEALAIDLDQSVEQLQTRLDQIASTPTTAAALKQLGDSLRLMGKLNLAQPILQRSLAIAQQLRQSDAIALAQISLGNLARSQPDAVQQALNYYQQAAASTSPLIKAEAQVNQLSLLADSNPAAAQTLAQALAAQIDLAALPSHRATINLQINLAQTLMKLSDRQSAFQLLTTAVEQAKHLGDQRLYAYALGSLGSVYEQTQQWAESEQVTQQALQLAQQSDAAEITYRWQWQLGRVLKAQQKNKEAIAAYQGAVSTIKSLRGDLATASPDVQFVFRDSVDPIHRQLVELLMQSNQTDDLTAARDVIESLQLVELDNFFREACLNADPEQVDKVDSHAAVIYPILLDDQLSIIVSLPDPNSDPNSEGRGRSLKSYRVPVARSKIEALAANIREDLDQSNTLSITLPWLQQMYDWLIRPEAADLAASQVETLVFVLDGGLRNIPMSALHDGQRYLVEQYSVALTPGLQLLAPRSRPSQNRRVLVAGLDAARPNFDALPYVNDELNQVQTQLPSKVLFNQQFTNAAFQNTIENSPFSIIHLATHGQFSSQSGDTFVLAWDQQIPISELGSTLQTAEISQAGRLDLLVLSACETAAGDSRAALGLAGVAVRSGARSTVGTLWRVNDEASARLMGRFYKELAQVQTAGVSKAEALRRAQLAILQDPAYGQEPYYWSSYVLVGNWL
jgi:CHAT domain-containing protein